ncbi:hypothetical protein BH11MYX4_BH11MYX4_67690 [soil metagenome]
MVRRRAPSFVLALTAGVALVTACSVGALDLTARACPCVDGYVCDLATNRCVVGLADDAAVLIDASDAADAADAATPPPLLVVSGLTATWVTPAAIRWDWKLTGAAADFRAYEVVTGASADGIDKRVGVDVLTSNERPELAGFDLRGGLANGTVDMWTLTDVRSAGTEQLMQVKITDGRGRASRSAIVAATSAAKTTSQLVLFDGTSPKTVVPAGDVVFRTPAGGESHYFFQTDCAGAKTCARRADLVALGLDLAPPGSPFTAAEFDRAILELQVEGNVAATSFDTSVALEPGDGTCNQGNGLCRFRFTGWTQTAAARRKIQVPLRELRNDAGKLTYAILQSKGFLVEAFALSGPAWKNGSTVLLYDARIRW